MSFHAPRTLVLGFLLCCSLIVANAQSYREELNLGIAAYKSSRYEDAAQHFRQATELDPSQTIAHLYLATTYVSQFIPGVDSPDNVQIADLAIAQYQFVLNSDAEPGSRVTSAKGVAYLYLNMKKWDEAKTYYRMSSDLDRNDPEPYFSLGTIDWTICYQPRMEARARLGLRPEAQLNGQNANEKKVCDDLRSKNTSIIEDGIASLNRAIELRPDYDDAMAYMNLLYRERADLECDDPAARAQDLRTADEWVDKTLAVKKAKAERVAP